jgi:hypothetical protein
MEPSDTEVSTKPLFLQGWHSISGGMKPIYLI